MGRKRQKVVRIIKRRLPDQYLCPKCGMNTITVILRQGEGIGRIICARCELRGQFPIPDNVQPVDAYCIFVDSYYGVEEPLAQ
jgi:transcription elongation factor Elf1